MSLLEKPRPIPTGSGLVSVSPFTGSNDQPEQTMESVLKKKRQKIASDKLGIQPEEDSAV